MAAVTNAATTGPPAAVAGYLNGCAEPVRSELLALRELILATAAETAGVGAITETLRWGQPAFLTRETGSGSAARTLNERGYDIAVMSSSGRGAALGNGLTRRSTSEVGGVGGHR